MNAEPTTSRSGGRSGPAHSTDPKPSRRSLILGGLAAAASCVAAACSRNGGDSSTGAQSQAGASTTQAASPTSSSSPSTSAATATTLAPTPTCDDGDDPTPAQTEGPYFKASSPETANLSAGLPGTKLVLTGTVVTTGCKAVDKALVDFWQADDAGTYDNAGYRLRGHQFTDAQGRYRLETVVPGIYPGRTRHIHVKVQAPGGRVLTTQLYFPGESRNASDGIYRAECLIKITDTPAGKDGKFQFVLA